MTRFYAPDIKQTLTLPEGESGHCCRVLRLSEGDDVEAVDGKGTLHRCRIIDAHPRRTGIEIIESIVEPRHWNPRITLALAPTKNMDRMEWLVEKAVEIGVDRIVFLDCEHSERRVVKPERIERIMVSAMKQSLKSRMPELTGMMPFADYVKEADGGLRFMGYCDRNFPRKEFDKEYDGVSDVSLLIGPEGDFSPTEVAAVVEVPGQRDENALPRREANVEHRLEVDVAVVDVLLHPVVDAGEAREDIEAGPEVRVYCAAVPDRSGGLNGYRPALGVVVVHENHSCASSMSILFMSRCRWI